ncbi:response regulator [Rhodanobacter sp. B2A1Ga4]|uniref:hybrid sensor histidine kinase/response regulator n=1 Tax=Rhodanobacter sp. B2A1Ga4 TaxID=2778647 RepID=UPI001B35AD83|nr:hybrid sensor histidine kinase/response regulator [Rhodanobacter sp. B2A1Ga4]MBQ4855303.1 response regulator [Rhodanobacter sp. B2A1Ga4]
MSAWLLGVVLGALFVSMPAVLAEPVAPDTQAAGPLPTPQFRRYGTMDGLPSGAIYAVAQDRNGLMWFGSAGGLVRFDGVGFKVFRHATDAPNSLPANPTYSLLIDRDNRVWTGGISTGLIAYDQKSERFRWWTHDDKQAASLASDEVWDMAQTADGTLWVATEGGLDRMRPDGSGFDHMPLDVGGGKHSASFGQTRALFAGADGRLWIGAESGLYLREPDGTMHKVPVDPSFRGDLSKTWRIDGGHGEIRVSLTGGLLIIGADGVARPLASRQLSSQRIMSSTRDAAGRLWIATADGVFLDRVDANPVDGDHLDGQLQRVAAQPLLQGGLPGSKTWQTTLDGEGGLWITFDQSSIAYLPPGWSGFSRFTHIPDDADSLTGIAASTILMSRDGRLWLGGNDGWIDKLDAVTGRIQHVVRGIQGQIVSLAEDTRGRLWIDSPPQLHLLDRGKLTSIDLGHARVTRPVLLCAGDAGRMYVASWNEGVFVVDPDSLAITPVPMEQGSDGILRPDQITFHAGSLWYASEGGLLRQDDKDGKLHFVPGIPRQEIVAFAFDATGFWLATSDSAIEHYRYADGRAVQDDSIDFGHEEPKSDLRDLRVDRQGRLWVFANPGLWLFDQHTRRFKSFGPAHGLSNANFDGTATAMAPDGMIFVASSGGVVAFQPERLLQTEKTGSLPALSLAYLNVQRAGEVRAIALDSKVVQLGWRDRDLRVGVRLASYVNPAVNRYRFRLHGFDSGWVDAGNRAERDFAGLAAGDYTLEVQAAGAGDRWVGLATPISIHVQAPPWLRWWAWVIYVLLLAALVGLVLRSWRRRMAQRHHVQLVEQQRQLAEAASAAKTQFLATLSHEIRTPMTGVMGMAELLLSTPLDRQQQGYTQAMQRSGGMLLKLLNDALDLARIEAGKLELEPVPFEPRQLLEDVAQLEQGLAHAKGIRFVLDVAEDLPAQLLGDAVRIKQILLNLANNALKFTEHGSVTLSAQRQPDGLQFNISDTGPGIPEASQARLFQRFEQADSPQRRAGSGLGLAICRELVDMMGGSIELESRLGYGSTFRVRLPLAEPAVVPPPVERPSGRSYRLLLVEDDTIVAAVIRGLLEREGHVVVHVVNGLAALAELAHTQFDAVLLDLDLPGVDGFQVARLIRQREHAGQHLPIVAVTARSGGEDEAKARAVGMDGFLHKPLSGEQLAAALARFVVAAGDAPP